MQQELKNCPDCGTEPDLMEDLILIWVECMQCGLHTQSYIEAEEAVKDWNNMN